MVTMAQRIEAMRDEKGLSRPALASALGFPKNAVEKFETGRATPTKEQQEKMANFFGVSLFYLRGESNDRTRLDAWLDGDFSTADDGPGHVPMKAAPKPQPKAQNTNAPANGGAGLFDAFLNSKQFQDMVRSTLMDVLRTPEGEELIAKVVRKEVLKQK